MDALIRIQKELKAPKGQLNKFGGYKYRSCEDILEAVKPLLGDAVLTLSDEIVELPGSPAGVYLKRYPDGTIQEYGGRVYIKATATLTEGDKSISVSAWAREQDSKKGMDAAQVTAACSSYARKYALNGLFLCDEGENDPDTGQPPTGPADWTPTTGPAPQPQQPTPATAPQGQIPAPTPNERQWLKMLWDFYVTQSGGTLQTGAKPMQKLLRLCQLYIQRYPGSMADVELLKKYIKIAGLTL